MNRTCPVCKTAKDVSAFSVDSAKPLGRKYICKKCVGKQYLEYYVAHKSTSRYKYNTYRNEALRRGLCFELTYKQFLQLWRENCHYCGCQITTIGIDRRDNNIGYTIDNCLPCCSVCNKMKQAQAYDNFLLHCHRIAARHRDP